MRSARNPLSKKSVMVIPMAIQNNIKPSIRFIKSPLTKQFVIMENLGIKVSFLERIGYTIEYVIGR